VEKSQAVYAGWSCRIKYGPASFTRSVNGPFQNRNWTTFHSPRSWAAQMLTCPNSLGSHVLCAYTTLFMSPYYGPYFLVGSDTNESPGLNQRPRCRAPRRSSPISTLSLTPTRKRGRFVDSITRPPLVFLFPGAALDVMCRSSSPGRTCMSPGHLWTFSQMSWEELQLSRITACSLFQEKYNVHFSRKYDVRNDNKNRIQPADGMHGDR
jgi:hypothetical protein